jgi:adenosylcobyric acid synthase
MATTLGQKKRLTVGSGRLAALALGARVRGYEIHLGVSDGPALSQPLLVDDAGHPDGAVSADGQIVGTYWHGLFEEAEAFAAFATWAGARLTPVDHAARREAMIDRLADAVAAHCQWRQIVGLFR